METILRAYGLTKNFGEFVAVDDVNFTVGDGQFVSVLGPSGCGKSTILKMIAGFLESDAGRIILRGKDMSIVPPEERRIGMVFQNYALFPHMTVGENVAYGLRVRRVPKADIKQKVIEKLALVGLEGFASRYPSQLSGGQMQRVALARAMAIEPQLLLMDEPLTALDKTIRDELRIQIRQFQQRLRIPTLFVTHDQIEALTMSDWIILLNKGRIEQAATPEDLYERPMTPFAARFIGNNNEFAVTRTGESTVSFAGNSWTFDPGNTVGDCSGAAAGFVRPEDIRFGPGENEITGVCEFISVEDSLVKYRIAVANGTVSCIVSQTRHSSGAKPALDESVTVSWPKSAIRMIGEVHGR